MTAEHPQVFIAYSHRDRQWLERLQIHLKPLERKGLIERWDDTQLQPGTVWQEEIQRALARARVAVLLISADFLASDLIAVGILPHLLSAVEANRVRVLPVLLSACHLPPELTRFQIVNSPEAPLSSLSEEAQEALLVKVIQTIQATLKISVETVSASDSASPPLPLLKRPYRGLAPYTDKQQHLFFGRAQDIHTLVEWLEQGHRWILVEGASGSGKSSLVAAGLIPTLKHRARPQEGPAWRCLIMRPGKDPVLELATVLYSLEDECRDAWSIETIEGRLNKGPSTLKKRMRAKQQPVLLVVDQFEELFIYPDAYQTPTRRLPIPTHRSKNGRLSDALWNSYWKCLPIRAILCGSSLPCAVTSWKSSRSIQNSPRPSIR